jgi:dienelactone hydrolase
MRLLVTQSFAVITVAMLRLLHAVDVAQAAAPQSVEIPFPDGNLRATLYRPDGIGPFPAVVALHGCAGVNGVGGAPAALYQDWGRRLADAGFAVLFPDSYGSRGLGSQCASRNRSVRVDRERVIDADSARRWLQEQTWIAPERVSLLGWSNGAIAALWAVRPQAFGQTTGPDFRSAVAFYPGCRRLGEAAWTARVPTMILMGGADDWTSPAACQKMVAGARGRSALVTLVLYPGAYHDFDHPNRPLQVRNGYAFSVDGTGKVHTGTNPAARSDSIKRVKAWLAR